MSKIATSKPKYYMKCRGVIDGKTEIKNLFIGDKAKKQIIQIKKILISIQVLLQKWCLMGQRIDKSPSVWILSFHICHKKEKCQNPSTELIEEIIG